MNSSLYFILLSFLPIFYKLGFWLYLIQLKEYRCDRIKDYLKTPQGKKAIFNFWFRAELIVLLVIISYSLGYIPNQVAYYSLVFSLQLESLYVFGKIFSGKIFLPKFTKRLIILAGLSIITILLAWLEIIFIPYSTYLVIIKVLFFLPVIVLFWNAVTGIFFDKIKENIYKKASEKLKNLNIQTTAITGSYGKSSTKEFLSTLLEEKFNVIKTPRNINTEIGISNFILNKLEKLIDKNKPNIFIAEAGAYSKGEIRQIGKILNHKDGFLTGLGNQHIGLFGGEQNLVEGKFEILEKVLENRGKLYLNIANIKIEGNYLQVSDKANIINYQVKNPEILEKLQKNKQLIFYPDDFKIIEIKKEKNQFFTKFIFNNEEFVTNIVGLGQIENLIGAIKYALNQGISLEKIKSKIKNLQLLDSTMKLEIKTFKTNKLENNQIKEVSEEIIIIDDSYNLSVNALINVVETIQYLNGKRILILDDILELGTQAYQIHYKIGKYLSNKVDEILYVGINYKKNILKGLKDGNFTGRIIDKKPEIGEKTILILEGRKAGKYKNLI